MNFKKFKSIAPSLLREEKRREEKRREEKRREEKRREEKRREGASGCRSSWRLWLYSSN
ncbi:hypothetical protein [Streptococcus pluranimalium]|uniref:hypothetical protein n=1 Tax=Streptococcus pluranimalium TaxID=82348 RepID=UPI003BF8A4A0